MSNGGQDVLEELKELKAGQSLASVSVVVAEKLVGVLDRAIAEITFLRSVSGAVSRGESWDDLKKAARDGKVTAA